MVAEAAVSGGGDAPNVEVTSSAGEAMLIASLWAERPLVLVFLPAFDSPFCADNAAQLRDSADLFDDAGVSVCAVCDVDAKRAAAFASANHIDYTLLADEHGSLRDAFGVVGHADAAPGGCATFIVDTDGVLRYEHRGVEADDYPPTWEVVARACEITGAKVEHPAPPPHVAPPPSLVTPADGSPFVGSGRDKMLGAGFACAKCGFGGYDVVEVSTASGIWSRIFNFQHRKFTAVTCKRCTFTELYKTDASGIANVLDLLVGR